jgi:SAM-dependent methyltransferase
VVTRDRSRSARFALSAFLVWAASATARRVIPQYQPRIFHNRVLREYLRYFSGDILNVSGWEDRDKEGGYYQDYFGHIDRYVVSNIAGDRGRSTLRPGVNQQHLDLAEPLGDEMRSAFDVVFCHTVLEHVYDTQLALQNIAEISRDVVVIVVPFSQSVHYTRTYSDYVRLSPFYLRRVLEEAGYTVLLSTVNDQQWFPIYVTMIAARSPERYELLFSGAPMTFEVQIFPGRYGTYGRAGMDVPDE